MAGSFRRARPVPGTSATFNFWVIKDAGDCLGAATVLSTALGIRARMFLWTSLPQPARPACPTMGLAIGWRGGSQVPRLAAAAAGTSRTTRPISTWALRPCRRDGQKERPPPEGKRPLEHGLKHSHPNKQPKSVWVPALIAEKC